MEIRESQLINLIKQHLVREYLEHGPEAMCAKKFLPLCAALLFPFKDFSIQTENNPKQGSITPIINAIKKTFKNDNILCNYTLESLRRYFQTHWLPTIDKNLRVQFLKGISLISSIEENGFFSLKGNQKVFEAYLKIKTIDISNNYGCNNYSNIDIEIPPKVREEIKKDKPTSITIKSDNEFRTLDALKNFILINFPISKYPNGLEVNANNYFWQYKLDYNQYIELKDILQNLKLKENIALLRRYPCDKEYGKVARYVALYISEWYKRESETLDGDHCLDAIGLKSSSKKIWMNSGLDNELLHKETSNEMRQTAMCTLGGFPIAYINKSTRFRTFINNLSELYHGKEETSDEDIENIVSCFDDNNGVFKRSLESGSCKEYLNALVDYLESRDELNLPFNKNDLEDPLFSYFIEKIQEGYDDDLPKRFFQPEIRIWTYDNIDENSDSMDIESEFYIHIGLKNNKNVITTWELSKLGVCLPSGIDTFDIRLKITPKEGLSYFSPQKRTYFKIGNYCESFCGVYGSDIATDIDLINTKLISLQIEAGGYIKEIYNYKVEPSLKLYSTSLPYLWTTTTNNGARIALFYDMAFYKSPSIDDQDIQIKSNGVNQWGWIILEEPITLEDHERNKIKFCLGTSEKITVDFRTKNLKKNVALSSEGCVRCVINGEEVEPVHLLYYSEGQDLILTCDGKKGTELTNNYNIEFKPFNENRYMEWNSQIIPKQGFITLRIRCLNESKKKEIWRGNVYFIPQNFPIINRNLEHNLILFKGDNIKPLYSYLTDYFDIKNNRFKDNYNYGLKSPTIPFRIGDEENYVIVDVYRAIRWQQISNQGSFIKDIINLKDPKIPIANILQENIRLKAVDENGYHEVKAQQDLMQNEYIKEYFYDPKEIALYNNTTDGVNTHNGFKVDDISGLCQRYIYLSRHEDISNNVMKVREIKAVTNINKIVNKILLNVSDKHIHKYNFFYWSGNVEDRPIELKKTRLGERSYSLEVPFKLDGKAVVFQSLRDSMPNLYFRPIYANENWKWHIYMYRYDAVKDNIDYLISCYQLAVDHKTYFCVFPSLRNLQDRDSFTKFIRSYIRLKRYQLSKDDLKNLTRLAQELSMDWFFINIRKFASQGEKDLLPMRECMKELLRYSPIAKIDPYFSHRFINVFFDKTNDFNVRNGKLPRQFLKAIGNNNHYNIYYNNFSNIENRVNFLNDLIKRGNNIFPEICSILNI